MSEPKESVHEYWKWNDTKKEFELFGATAIGADDEAALWRRMYESQRLLNAKLQKRVEELEKRK